MTAAILFKTLVFIGAVACFVVGAIMVALPLAVMVKQGSRAVIWRRAVPAFLAGGALAWLGIALAMVVRP